MKLEANVHTLVWGSESWEVSAHSSSPSVVADGEEKGKTLAELMPNFPLLAKVIDAKSRLSVQVHPNEKTALVTGGEPKTEMWCVLEPGPIYAGLKPGTGAKEIEEAIGSGSFEEILVKHEAKRFDTFFIPGGLVHAIGDGVKLYEIQQSSNTTYRLYDWGRLGTDGKPRELHIEKSLESIDFSLGVPVPQQDIDCEFFNFVQRDFNEPTEVLSGSECLIVYEVEKAASTLLLPGEKSMVGPGRVFLTTYSLKPEA